ncbi:hypothetical protein ACGFNX_40650 [Streptomyces sp. NPDC048723]|uniref:hypothetical protein n=1 Tax=Streptomyces sp. NPDC048723 TaxID=3365589 RepID=UPI00371A53C4
MSAEVDKIINDMQPMGEELSLSNAVGAFAYPGSFGPGEPSADAAGELSALGDLLEQAADSFSQLIADYFAVGKSISGEVEIPELVALAHLADEMSRGASAETLARIKQQIITTYSARAYKGGE